MTEAEFERSVEEGIRRFAKEAVRRGYLREDSALATSRAEFAELLPQGRGTAGRVFAVVRESSGGRRVGETWYRLFSKGGMAHVWVDWIAIDPEFRRRGFGSEVLELIGREGARTGAEELGLNVFADNPEAVAFYQKLGFRVTSQHLARPIDPTRRPA